VIGLVALATGIAGAADDGGWQSHVAFILSERVREEFVEWFRPPDGKAPTGANDYNFFASQLRGGLEVTLPHLVFAGVAQYTQLQGLPDDASLTPPLGSLGPGALYFANSPHLNRDNTDPGEVFLKEGRLTLVDIPGVSGLSVTGGRFEYSDGLETTPTDPALAWLKKARIGERLVGPFGYTHVTRSFDGGRLVYDQPMWNLTAVGFRPTHGGFELSANRELEDIVLAGAAATLKQLPGTPPLDVRAFYLYYEDRRFDRAAATSPPIKVDNRPGAVRKADTAPIAIHTWGGHAATVVDAGPGRIDGLLWGAVQEGAWGELHHLAWAYAVEGGYQLPRVPGAPWLRAGYDVSSGDDNPNDTDHHTFFQVLPTARIYAQFPFFNMMNTQDTFAQLIVKPCSRVTVRTDYHWLRLTEKKDLWYAGGGATNNDVFGFSGIPANDHRELASLVDLGVSVNLLKQLTAYGYFGHAFGQGVVKKTFAGSDANYGYVELTFRY
jgi:hypothetical protein